MLEREIILIDDKPYGLRQIEAAIPEDRRGQYRLRHCSSFSEYREAALEDVFMVLLDFFLDADLTYGSVVAEEIDAVYLVGFSSMMEFSEEIVAAAAERKGDAGRPKLFAVQKLKGCDVNPQLSELFRQIL